MFQKKLFFLLEKKSTCEVNISGTTSPKYETDDIFY